MPKPKVKGTSSERIARSVLERLGYEILETNKIISVNQAKVFEVDILALSPGGEEYCVEVKAGRAGVSDVRQVFADSKVLSLKPLLVCKGFADDAAEAVAKDLDVKMISLSEQYLLLEPEELEVIVRSAVSDVLSEYGFYPLPPWEAITVRDLKLIDTIAEAEDFQEAARHLSLNVEELGHRIGELRKKGTLPEKGQAFSDLKRHCQQLGQRLSLVRRLDKIENSLRKIEAALRSNGD